MSTLIDISVRLEEGMPIWPGSVGYHRHAAMQLAAGDPANVSRLDFDVHCGTHVEAPLHFLPDGTALDGIPLEIFVGPAWVADVGAVADIDRGVLDRVGIPARTVRLLLRTRNSGLWETRQPFRDDYVGLTVDAAAWVADRGIRLVGVDYLSVQRYADDFETHRVLLRADVVILEGLNLSGVEPGGYELTCLPVRISGAEAAPVRAVLRRGEPR